MTTIRKPYGKSIKVQITCEPESRTKQSMKDECDINKILRKHQATDLKHFAKENQGSYGDLTTAVDFHTAQNILLQAQNTFDDLPSNVRQRFDNKPIEFLKFIHDPNNEQEAYDLGLTLSPPKIIKDETQTQTTTTDTTQSEI